MCPLQTHELSDWSWATIWYVTQRLSRSALKSQNWIRRMTYLLEGGPIAHPGGIDCHQAFALSPDDRSVAFIREDETGAAIYLASLDGSGERRLIARAANIWSADVADGSLHQLTDFKTDMAFAFDFSRDGTQLACARGVTMSDVVLISGFR